MAVVVWQSLVHAFGLSQLDEARGRHYLDEFWVLHLTTAVIVNLGHYLLHFLARAVDAQQLQGWWQG